MLRYFGNLYSALVEKDIKLENDIDTKSLNKSSSWLRMHEEQKQILFSIQFGIFCLLFRLS